MIGIIFAMNEELSKFLELVDLKKKNKIYDIDFYECSYKNKQLILVESGIGKVNAARGTQILLDNYDIKYVFNIGVAGAVNENIKILDIVVGNKLVQYDFDLIGFGYELGYVPKVGTYIETDSKLLSLAANDDVHVGVIASGDKFVTSKKIAKEVSDNFNALCVEMEGASIAQVCYLSKVPFLVIRSISDSIVKSNNKMDYDEFLDISSEKVSKYLIDIINKI